MAVPFDLPVVSVDFNDVEGDVVATARENLRQGQALAIDQVVELREGETVSCWARVSRITEHLIEFTVAWSTWRENSARALGNVVDVELGNVIQFPARSEAAVTNSDLNWAAFG